VGGSGIFAAIDKEMLSIVGDGTKDTENTVMWGHVESISRRIIIVSKKLTA
jgi:hypothetical protein